MIKYLDLKKINEKYKEEFNSKFNSFIDSGSYILGKEVEDFENAFANYCGVKYCIGVASGLDALVLIFKAYINIGKLKKGDKVMVPANTFYATILGVINAELVPVLIGPDENSFNINPNEIEKNINSEVRAIVPVHLYGQLANMNAINAIAKKNNLLVIEDAAQAHGAQNYEEKKAGGLGNAAAFSFYPTKNLGALGDAGAITTDDLDLAQQLRTLRNYGSPEKYKYDALGINSRLDELQAGFLNIKLKNLDKENEIRNHIAKKYISEIDNTKVKLPFFSGEKDHVFYAFVVKVEDRNKFTEYLKMHSIEINIHYPIPPNHQPALNEIYKSMPITEKIHKTVVSLPLNVSLSEEEIDKIIRTVNSF